MKCTRTHKELEGLETEIGKKNPHKVSALPPRNLGALVRGLEKVPKGGTVSSKVVKQAHSQGQRCKMAQYSTVEKANDVVRSNQTTTFVWRSEKASLL